MFVRNLSMAAFGAALVLASAAPIGAQGGGSMSSMSHGSMMMMKSMTIPLKEQNGSGESGTAMLQDTKSGLMVKLMLKNAKGTQPAHIHKGTCAKLDPKPWYPLTSVMNGTSTTTIPHVTIAMILGKSAINIHKSAKELKVYVACGDVAK